LPHIDGEQIQLVEHTNRDQLISLYQGAKVTLVPTKWNEPFGLVPVESMACGTPAVSYDRGGVSETIAEGTGYLVKESEGIDGLTRRVGQICELSPDQYSTMCETARKHVEDHFSIAAMTDGYEAIYENVLSRQ
jgi:glycosyltransferase involved in cell wall biosynthesis